MCVIDLLLERQLNRIYALTDTTKIIALLQLFANELMVLKAIEIRGKSIYSGNKWFNNVIR
jgi:hypothetical protein